MDVIQSLAKIAQENGYCRPEIDDGDVIEIKEGRHPVIEKIIGLENYIANDVYLDNATQQLMLITGPNMAGKSTYMRQVALCVILARIGSFVPAKSAKIGKIDRIFTRVGASDDLAAGQSTFMVEMCETSNILRNATRNSLIILDEIGRGTSTYDGLSIAWSVSEYLLNPKIGAKTLFATHYHELVRLAAEYDQVKNFYVAVKEKDGTIIFLRKILPGGIDKSYGIQVARLAGLPEAVLRRAKQILALLESKEETPDIRLTALPTPVIAADVKQKISPELETLTDEITQLDLNQITPLTALLQIEKWQKAISAARR